MEEAFYGHLPHHDGNAAAELTDFVLEDDAPQPSLESVAPEQVREAAITALKTVYDPEIPVNIYDLGLIYHLEADESGSVDCHMTLTAPGCPVAGALIREVHQKLLSVDGANHVRTELVWDPPWTRERMSEAALLELGFF